MILSGERTRVAVNTVFNLGKSDIPASRMLIEESRSDKDERSEVTDAFREALGDKEAMAESNNERQFSGMEVKLLLMLTRFRLSRGRCSL